MRVDVMVGDRGGILTDEHPTSSYRQPVVLIEGEPHGPKDVPQLSKPLKVQWTTQEKLLVAQFLALQGESKTAPQAR